MDIRAARTAALAAPSLAAFAREEGDVVVLRLETPVRLSRDSAPIAELRFAQLRAGHLRALKSHDMDGLLSLVAAATSESPRVIDLLHVADALRAVEVVQLDFPAGPLPGGPT